jgi:hypothetical protein
MLIFLLTRLRLHSLLLILVMLLVPQISLSQNANGWSLNSNIPAGDTQEYFHLIRTDYQFRLQDQDNYVKYSIDIRINPCKDAVKAGGRGDQCCRQTNVAGCQHNPDIFAGSDMQVAFLQNAHIPSCNGTVFQTDPNCGTYLEVHRPGNREVLADVQIDNVALPNGYMTVFLATHRLCLGHYEVWWVVRTRSGPYVQKVQPFNVLAPSCDAPPNKIAQTSPGMSTGDIP